MTDLRRRKAQLTEELGGDKMHDAVLYGLEGEERALMRRTYEFRTLLSKVYF